MDDELNAIKVEKKVLEDIIVNLRKSTEDLELKTGEVTDQYENSNDEIDAITLSRREIEALVTEKNVMSRRVFLWKMKRKSGSKKQKR